MRGRFGITAAAALVLALAGAVAAGATTTLDETLRVRGSGFKHLKAGPGEPFTVRTGHLGKAKRNRAQRRRSIAYFSQLTDPQIADEMSPLRVELIDPAGGEVSAAWRSQEAIGGHQTIATMNNDTPDEAVGPYGDPPQPRSDVDPRNSEPIHLGRSGPASVRSLLLNYPNVVAAVTGHTHHNDIVPHRRKGARRGFWEINTASHVDFPQQSRLIELMDNRDGTLSIFGTIVDQAAPPKPPKPGPAGGFSNSALAALSRELAANDPQTIEVTSGGGPGKPNDRNVELILRDPRLLAKR